MDGIEQSERSHRRGMIYPIRMANVLTFVAVLLAVGTFIAFCAGVDGMTPPPGGGEDDGNPVLFAFAVSAFFMGMVLSLALAGLAVLLRCCAEVYRHLTREDA